MFEFSQPSKAHIMAPVRSMHSHQSTPTQPFTSPQPSTSSQDSGRATKLNAHIVKDYFDKKRTVGTRSWLLHYDNAPAHNALEIREFLA